MRLAAYFFPQLVEDEWRDDVVTQTNVGRILQELRPLTMARELTPELRDVMRATGTAAMLEVGVTTSFSMVSPAVVKYLSSFGGSNIASITKTTRKQLARTLGVGVEAGESARQLAVRVKETLGLPKIKGRALTIARTEVHNAATASRLEGYAQSGLVPKKKWKATLDARVRDPHRRLNGKTVNLKSPFRIGGLAAQAPGQFGVAAQDINCRCTILPVVPKADSLNVFSLDLSDEESTAQFWRLVHRHERPMYLAALRGFAKWEAQVIRQLRIADRS